MMGSKSKPYNQRRRYRSFSFASVTNMNQKRSLQAMQNMVERLQPSEKDKKKLKKTKKQEAPPSLQVLKPTIPEQQQGDDGEQAMADLLDSLLTGQPQSIQTEVVEEKPSYNLNVCPFHHCNLTVFQAVKNKDHYVKCAFLPCGLFTHSKDVIPYMTTIYTKVDGGYYTMQGNIKCECNNQASLKVSRSEANFNRPYYACRNRKGCRFFQWADVPLTIGNEELQKRLAFLIK